MAELLERPKPVPLYPLRLRKDLILNSDLSFAELVINESNKQVQKKGLKQEEDQGEFRLGCDGLNLYRLVMRMFEENREHHQVQTAYDATIKIICGMRNYEEDEFRTALVAMHSRARIPYGMHPLPLAWARSKRSPIKLIVAQLMDSKAATLIAGLAYELQLLIGDGPIMLPIDDVRKLVGLRKLVVSGTVIRLVQTKILDVVDGNYHTGRAKQYRFIGQAGRDFVQENETKEEIPF